MNTLVYLEMDNKDVRPNWIRVGSKRHNLLLLGQSSLLLSQYSLTSCSSFTSPINMVYDTNESLNSMEAVKVTKFGAVIINSIINLTLPTKLLLPMVFFFAHIIQAKKTLLMVLNH